LLLAQQADWCSVGHGWKLAHTGSKGNFGVKVRPHPGPLAREREKSSQHTSDLKRNSAIQVTARSPLDLPAQPRTGWDRIRISTRSWMEK
jgi:hypothetical protein